MLYHEKMLSGQDVEKLQSAGKLWGRLVHIQCRKPSDVVTRTADLLNEAGRNKEATQLRGQWV